MQHNKTDLVVSTAKSIVGVAPFVGPLLSELVGTLIPNQRIDRLSKYVQELDEKLSKFDQEYLREELKKEVCSDLFEEGFRQATRSLSDERREYIASVVMNSLDEKHVSYEESKHIMMLLEELSDIEIIWLNSYYLWSSNDTEFRERHKNILEPVIPAVGDRGESRTKHALQMSYRNHLERLGLIDAKYDTEFRTNTPKYDTFTGKQKVMYYRASQLGELLLKYIGLIKADNA